MKNIRNETKTESSRRSTSRCSQVSSQGSDGMHDGKSAPKCRKKILKEEANKQPPAEVKKVKVIERRSRTAMTFSKSTVASRNKLVKRPSSAGSDKQVKVGKSSPKRWKALRSNIQNHTLSKTEAKTQERWRPKRKDQGCESSIDFCKAERDGRPYLKSRSCHNPNTSNRVLRRGVQFSEGKLLIKDDNTSPFFRRDMRDGVDSFTGENSKSLDNESSIMRGTYHRATSSSERELSSSPDNRRKKVRIKDYSINGESRSRNASVKVKPKPIIVVSGTSPITCLKRKCDTAEDKIAQTMFNKGTQRAGNDSTKVFFQERDTPIQNSLSRSPVAKQNHPALTSERKASLPENLRVGAQTSPEDLPDARKVKDCSEYSTTSGGKSKTNMEEEHVNKRGDGTYVPCCNCSCLCDSNGAQPTSWFKDKAVRESTNAHFSPSPEMPVGNLKPCQKRRTLTFKANPNCSGILDETQEKLSDERIRSPSRCYEEENKPYDDSRDGAKGHVAENEAVVQSFTFATTDNAAQIKPTEHQSRNQKDSLLSKALVEQMHAVADYQALLSQNMRSLLAQLDRIAKQTLVTSTNQSDLSYPETDRHSLCSQSQTCRLQLERFIEEQGLGQVKKMIEKFENKCGHDWRDIPSSSTSKAQWTKTCGSSIAAYNRDTDQPVPKISLDIEDRPDKESGSSYSAVERRDDKRPGLGAFGSGANHPEEQSWLSLQELHSISFQVEDILAAARYSRDWIHSSRKTLGQADKITSRSPLTTLLKEMDTWKRRLPFPRLDADHVVRGGYNTLDISVPCLSLSVASAVDCSSGNRNFSSSCVEESTTRTKGRKPRRLRSASRHRGACRTVKPSRETNQKDWSAENHHAPADYGWIQFTTEGMETEHGSQQHLQKHSSLERSSWRLYSTLLFVTVLLQVIAQLAITYFKS